MPEWLPNTVDPDDPDPFVQGGNNPRNIYTNTNTDDNADGSLVVLDAWGVPIRAIHPGRVADWNVFGDSVAIGDIDLDGTVILNSSFTDSSGQVINTEEIYGTCLNRRVLFVSAGPDRKFGDRSADEESALFQQTLDNIYSYPLEN